MAETKTKEFDGVIATSNRLFITVTQIGMCNENGRVIFAAGYNGKRIAIPDRPIRSLILPLMEDLISYAKYSDPENMDDDIEALKTFVNGLTRVKKVENAVADSARGTAMGAGGEG